MKVHLAFPHQDWHAELEHVPRVGEHVYWHTPDRDVDAMWNVTDVIWTINPDSPETTVMLVLEPATPDNEAIVAAHRQTRQ